MVIGASVQQDRAEAVLLGKPAAAELLARLRAKEAGKVQLADCEILSRLFNGK